jgi:hypothetical protein
MMIMGIIEGMPEEKPKDKEGILAGLFDRPKPPASPIPPRPQLPQGSEVPPHAPVFTDDEILTKLREDAPKQETPLETQPGPTVGPQAGLTEAPMRDCHTLWAGIPGAWLEASLPSAPAGLQQQANQDVPQQANAIKQMPAHHPDRLGVLTHLLIWVAVFMLGALIGFGVGYLYAQQLQAVASSGPAVLNFSQIG